MLGIISDDFDDTLAIKIEGELSTDDYEKVMPSIEQTIENEDTINFYCEVKEVDGLEPGAIWEDLKFDVKHYNDFKRIVVLGDKKWTNWLTQLAKPFTSGEVNYFNNAQKDLAWDWVRKGLNEV